MNERPQITLTRKGLMLLASTSLVLLVLLPLLGLFAAITPHDSSQLVAIREQLTEPALQAAFLRTAAVALLACGIASILGVPVGFAAAHHEPHGSHPDMLLGLLPLAVPPMLTAAVLRQLGLDTTIAGRWTPTAAIGLDAAELQLILVYALHYFPLVAFAIAAALRRLDGDARDAAQALGANGWTIWRQITLPLAMPGFLLGIGLMLLRIIEDMATPLVLGIDGMLAPHLLHGLLAAGPGDPGVQLTAMLMTTMTALIVLLSWHAFSPPVTAFGCCKQRSYRRRSGIVSTLPAGLLLIAAGVLALLPYAGLVRLVITEGAGTDIGSLWASLSDNHVHAMAKTLLFATFAGLLMLLGATLFGSLPGEHDLLSRTVRGSCTALLAVPAVVFALALLFASQHTWGNAGPINVGWAMLALVVALKLMPIGQYLIAARMRAVRPAMADRAYGFAGALSGRRNMAVFTTLAGGQLLVFLLAFTAMLAEVSSALVLLRGTDMPFAAWLFEDIRAKGIWSVPAALLLAVVIGMLVAAIRLWQPSNRHCGARPKRHTDLLSTP